MALEPEIPYTGLMKKRWELTPLRPDWITVEIDGVTHSGREMKNIHASYRDWKIESGERLLPGDEDKVWEAVKAKYPKFIIRRKKPGKPGVSISAAFSFIRYLEKRMKNKGLVEALEAQRRANICLQCPKKSAVLGCSICKQALKMFVSPPQELQPRPPEACGACGCWLPGKVWIPREVLGPAEEFEFAEPDDASGFPGCWML
jgi:hypothetical protein